MQMVLFEAAKSRGEGNSLERLEGGKKKLKKRSCPWTLIKFTHDDSFYDGNIY